MVCPRCGSYQKMNIDECTSCGFNYKIAFEKAENRDKQLIDALQELQTALDKGDKLNAYISLGKLKMLEDPKFNLHCAMVLSRDGEYSLSDTQLALYVYDKEDKSDNLYLSKKEEEAFPWKMENYALTGQLTMAMITHYGTQRAAVDLYHRLHCIQIAFDNASDEELANWLEIDELHDSSVPRSIDAENSLRDEKYIVMFLQHLCLDMVHLVLFERKFHEASELDPQIEKDSMVKDTIMKYVKLLTLLPIHDENGETPIQKLLSTPWSEVSSPEFVSWLDEQISGILLNEYNPMPEEPTNYITYFECLQELGLMQRYCKMAQKYIKKLLEYSHEYPDEIQHILGTAYFVARSNGILIKKSLEDYISENLDGIRDEEEEEENNRIINSLSKKGIAAYEVAEWEFKNSQAESFGWRDAGPISLSFFRIIELELNQKLIAGLLNVCTIDELSECYNKDQENLVRHELKLYKNAWGTHLRILKSIKNTETEIDGMLLGPLKDFVDDIVRYEETEIGRLIHSRLTGTGDAIMTEKGYDALLSGELVDVISDEKRTRYRNPPAHTRYLPYSVAKECRDFVRSTIIKLGVWFN